MSGNTMKHPKPWQLHDITLADVREHQFSVAVLPLGATEPHNFHLPYGTDTIEATELVSQCCSAAWDGGVRVVQLPTIPYGTETNMQSFPLAMNIMPSTMLAILRDLTNSLENSGITRLVIFNSHGGNELKPILRELVPQTTVQLFLWPIRSANIPTTTLAKWKRRSSCISDPNWWY
jgi:creatinine amidohydrolase